MIYEVSLYARVPEPEMDERKTNNRGRFMVDAVDDKDAEKKARILADNYAEEYRKKLIELLGREQIEVSPSTYESDKNYTFEIGSIHLIKRYSKWLPAKCIHSVKFSRYVWAVSAKTSGYVHRGQHEFQFLGTEKRLRLKTDLTKTHKRLGRMLCKDGIIKPKCDKCPAKFSCYTRKDED